ncbi:hypothetical protein SDRG_06013 [Saprolegnia diclina VS20]|uniref:Uncharacterized protein n=1 Tax=Saprolegnia diclina (strain VS20) TaxID=1156394 RepID=T0S1M5_SAPDV|nr:hypothetical protein SDRG_06013 [Saprolegnia diclina VS20]EQC36567.1 hypothetical protein SDRG_06013 [Saprolegnia diclina VS20]|eukprot:XP_008609988.1 hypothetical protein SDRG_06013 [Saprolegnia diclina VS20]
MRRRGRVTQEEIAMDNIRQLQGQIHDMQRDKANLLSENQDLASALVQPLLVHLHLMDHPPQNLTRSDLASARKKTIELQMAMGTTRLFLLGNDPLFSSASQCQRRESEAYNCHARRQRAMLLEVSGQNRRHEETS